MISFKEYQRIDEAADAGLAAKAEKSGVSIGTLRKVYRRGVAAWNSGHRPGTTPQQWGMARVNSYITKGKGTYHGADKDLREEEMSEAVINFPKTKDDHPRAITKDDVQNAWALKVHAAKEDKISYQHNGVTIHHSDGKHTFVLGGHKPLFDKDSQGKLSFKKDFKGATTAYAFPTRSSNKNNVVSLKKEEAAVPKDKESGLPKKYVAGLSDATAKARASHWKEKDKLSDSDPKAYEPAPGDATAKTKESKHTKKYRAMFGEDMDEEIYEACWKGYKQIGLKKKGDRMVPNCVKEEEDLDEATYKGKTVPLNKPMTGDVKKSKVFVDPDGDGKAQKVNFGDKTLSIKKHIPARKKSYCARSAGQGNTNDKTSANYWSRKAWEC